MPTLRLHDFETPQLDFSKTWLQRVTHFFQVNANTLHCKHQKAVLLGSPLSSRGNPSFGELSSSQWGHQGQQLQ